MPTNVTAEYKTAESAYRAARDPQERLDALREMLRAIPKHKGTEHVQADIKSRIKELTDELSGPRKTGARGGPPTVVRPEGAGQISLLGPPNSGKSALHAALTGSRSVSEPYPFATQFPQPGMLAHEDVTFQLVDLPSISSHHDVPWIANAVQPADGALLVLDLTDPGCVEQATETIRTMADRRVRISSGWPMDPGGLVRDDDPFVHVLPTLAVISKCDLLEDPASEVAAFRELSGIDLPLVTVSAHAGAGLASVGPFLFDRLGVVRVYTRSPGSKVARDGRPYTLRRGDTVLDVARLVHKEIAEGLQFARVWGEGGDFDGQQVGRDHVLVDGDIIELH